MKTPFENKTKEIEKSKIYLFDTYTRRKRLFIPLEDKVVKMYTCGPTVYNYPHIGNLRAYVFADILKRTLEFNGFIVKHVMNITDVGHLTSDADTGEDKIELQAKKLKRSAWEIAEYFTEIFKRDISSLNIKPPSIWCKATEHIQDQIALIQKLEKLGYTYKTSDGIYFDTSKFPNYGYLARIKLEKQKPGIRIPINPEKRNYYDFALWKFSPKDQKRQMEWESPWGIGFPGWHIECSAMAMKYLGETLDIHTGGVDHIPIHHTNEIAQSEAATNKQFVRYWLHVAFLVVNNEKMSKSKGNVYTLKDIIDQGFDPLAFRYLLLTAHYRSTLNFTWEALRSAQVALDTLRSKLSEFPDGGKPNIKIIETFRKYINDDLSTPKAIALLWDLMKFNIPPTEKKATILVFDEIFGLGLKEIKYTTNDVSEISNEVVQLLEERKKLRLEKRWDKADEIRKKIEMLGYIVQDLPDGNTRLIKRKKYDSK